MVRKSAVWLSLLGLAVSVPALSGCHASFQAGSSADEAPPPPPPAQATAPGATAATAAEPAAAPTATATATAETAAAPTATATATTETAAAPAAETSTASNVEVKGDSIKIPGNIVFDTGKATLKAGAGSETVLEQLKAYLDKTPKVTKLRVEGHTDNVGQADANVELSGQRALTVKRWLVEHGIAKDRLIAAGFGMAKPIADNSTEEGRSQNRRTEFKIAELFGKRYLNRDPNGGGKVYDY